MAGDTALNEETAQACSNCTSDRLCRDRKLVLLVDPYNFMAETRDSYAKYIQGTTMDHRGIYQHFRAGLTDFFREICKHYILFICHLSSKESARRRMGLLDPGGQFFGNRMFTRENISSKDDAFLHFPRNARNMIIALDDVQSAFVKNRKNWLPLPRYMPFYDTNRAFRSSRSESSLERVRDNFRIIMDKTTLDGTQRRLLSVYEAVFGEGRVAPEKCFEELVAVEKEAMREFEESHHRRYKPQTQPISPRHWGLTRDYLKSNRKLILLVDLDHTIINSCSDDLSCHIFKKGLTQCSTFALRSRPFLQGFLREVSEAYEMVVTTFGGIEYAKEIVKVIDPSKRYFKNRILAKDDIDVHALKKEHVFDLLPHEVQDMIVIIDDNPCVWPTTPIIPVDKYTFFHNDNQAFSADYLASLSPYPEERIDVQDNDQYLLSLMNDLLNIQQFCYENPNPPRVRPDSARDFLEFLWRKRFSKHPAVIKQQEYLKPWRRRRREA